MQDFRVDQSAQPSPMTSLIQSNSDKRKKKYTPACLVLLCCLISLAGCRHRVQENPQPEPVPPEKYSIEATDHEGNRPPQWWLSLNDAASLGRRAVLSAGVRPPPARPPVLEVLSHAGAAGEASGAGE